MSDETGAPGAALTPAQVRTFLQAAEQAAEAARQAAEAADGAQAEAMAGNDDIRRELREFRERFEDVVDFMLDVVDYYQASPEERARQATAARGLTELQIRQMVAQLRERLDRAPTQAETARELHTSAPTLRRAMLDLGMGSWPPPAP